MNDAPRAHALPGTRSFQGKQRHENNDWLADRCKLQALILIRAKCRGEAVVRY